MLTYIVEFVFVDMRQIIEGHITMTEHHPQHRETADAIKTMNYIWIINFFNSKDFGCIGKDRESQK